jgi:hypothetical protein
MTFEDIFKWILGVLTGVITALWALTFGALGRRIDVALKRIDGHDKALTALGAELTDLKCNSAATSERLRNIESAIENIAHDIKTLLRGSNKNKEV